MVTINIGENLDVKVEDVLSGISKLGKSDMESFLDKVANLVAAEKVSRLSERETELMLVINNRYPKKIWSRYEKLHKKLQAENISKKEHQELLKLVQQIEKHSGIWLNALVELSNFRQVTIDELMKQLKINLRYRVENQS